MTAEFLLIRKMKQGDERAFDIFVHKYYQNILNYCHYHCFDQAYAEDLTQETFVRFFANLADYHYKGKTLNYLYTIAGNLCKDYWKKIKGVTEKEAESDEKRSVEEHLMDEVLNKIYMEQVLKQLPEELREVLTLYYFEDMKLIDISDILQIGLPLVKYRLRQAKKRLEELLREEDGL